MWATAVDHVAAAGAARSAGALEQRILRFFPLPEPQIAATLRELEPTAAAGVTTCLRRGELEVATVFAPAGGRLLVVRGWRCARGTGTSCSPTTGRRSTRSSRALLLYGADDRAAESCTGGLMAGGLTDLAGSSAYVLGGLAVYSNEAKTALPASRRR